MTQGGQGPSLQEELARRLGYVYRKTHGWDKPEVHWGDKDRPDDYDQNSERLTWLKVADECIRQMEWTRQPWEPQPELTLAPEDWKPWP